jgi:hypothetical protein
MHFINCHGGPASPEFQGQLGESSYPVSLTTQTTAGQIAEGTVAAVECCYGAELYDSITLGIDRPICQSYLGQGAYGYLGSTTIAYGPADDNGAADLLCQYFLMEVLLGASTGRAALVARQKFVANVSQMDPVDLKSLAQFCLLGDPSVHPVVLPATDSLPHGMQPAAKRAKSKSATKAMPMSAAAAAAERFFRAERRAKLRSQGEFLLQSKPTASKRAPKGRVSPHTKTALTNLAKLAGLGAQQAFTAFAVKGAAARRKGQSAKAASVPSRYFLAVGTPAEPKLTKGAAKPTASKVQRGVAVVAKELDGRIVGYRIYHQR